MSDIIHLLPDSVANQIAAGEVIQRPASVLKELVENSIDAGATFVQILIKDAGRTLIQVVDNGKGMSETDARMAFERHATSKITDAVDLFSLKTMGFRGEALASIAAVAQVELRTRRHDDELGILVEIAGTRVFKQEMLQCDIGTMFQVKNLFFNVPARRRFLKSDNVEKSHILTEFYRIVLVNPNVGFSLIDSEDEIFQLPASNTKVRIENVFGKNAKKRWQQQLLPIDSTTNLGRIYGYIGKPEFAQKSAIQYFFVNGRYMRHPYFNKAISLAYNQMINTGENANYFIYFEVDPQTIDVNIHPTKTEIKFENEQALWSILSAIIKEALGKFNIAPSIDFDQEGALDIPSTMSPENVRPPQTNFNPNYNPFGNTAYKRPNLDWEELYGKFEKKEAPIQSAPNWTPTVAQSQFIDSTVPEVQQQLEHTDTKAENRADLFQFKNRYIITSLKSGMLLVEQHRAHIRILFDTFIAQIENRKAYSQQVLFPEVLELSPDDNLIFEQMMLDLQHVGFDFEPLGNNAYNVKGVPDKMGTSSSIDLLLLMLDRAKTTAENLIANMHESIALSLAESLALKTGQRLTVEEMSDLIDRLFACENHNFTPDGKKIMTILTHEEIEKRF